MEKGPTVVVHCVGFAQQPPPVAEREEMGNGDG
jgi:hypothetical protein